MSSIRLCLLCYHSVFNEDYTDFVFIISHSKHSYSVALNQSTTFVSSVRSLFSNVSMYGWYPCTRLPPGPCHTGGTLSRYCHQRGIFAPTISWFLTRQRLSATAHTGSILQPLHRQNSSENKPVSYVERRKGRKNWFLAYSASDCLSVSWVSSQAVSPTYSILISQMGNSQQCRREDLISAPSIKMQLGLKKGNRTLSLKGNYMAD